MVVVTGLMETRLNQAPFIVPNWFQTCDLLEINLDGVSVIYLRMVWYNRLVSVTFCFSPFLFQTANKLKETQGGGGTP